VYHGEQAKEVEAHSGLPLLCCHSQTPESWATTAHTLLLQCAAKMPCLYQNSPSALSSQSSPSPPDHPQKVPETQGQRKASPAGGSCGSSGLGDTTQPLTGRMLLEQPSAGPDRTSTRPTAGQRQCGKLNSLFSFGGLAPTQLSDAAENSTFSNFFSFIRFECAQPNEAPGRRQLLGYLPRQLQRVGGDDKDPEPPTPSLDQEWDRDENILG